MVAPGSVWRERDFVLLVTGTTVNGIGDWLLELALPLYVFIETGSGLATAAVYIINLVVGVLLGGAAIGGAAIAVGGMPAVVVADAATFVVGALTAWLLSAAADRSPLSEDPDVPIDSSVRAGLREVRTRPSIAALIGIQALSGFPNVATQVGSQSTAQSLCPPHVLGRLGGLMSAAGALGMGAGSLTAGFLLGTFTARQLFNGQVAILAMCGLIGLVFVVQPLRADGSGSSPAAHEAAT